MTKTTPSGARASTTAAAGGKLSIVATPIGNLEDITLRALRTLREVDVILAEDTRHTGVLCKAHDIHRPLRSLHAHSTEHDIERAVEELVAGKHFALVTDAGTPLVSDPGAALVRAAQERGVRIESIPGASALTAAMTVSGIACDTARFVGFLPRTGKRRRAVLDEIAQDRAASVMFESPQRLAATLDDLAQVLGSEREVAVCRELTKLHEEVVRGTLSVLLERFAEGARGEITLVIAGRGEEETTAETEGELDARISALLATGVSVRDAVHALTGSTPLARHALYARVQALKIKPEL